MQVPKGFVFQVEPGSKEDLYFQNVANSGELIPFRYKDKMTGKIWTTEKGRISKVKDKPGFYSVDFYD